MHALSLYRDTVFHLWGYEMSLANRRIPARRGIRHAAAGLRHDHGASSVGSHRPGCPPGGLPLASAGYQQKRKDRTTLAHISRGLD